MGLTSCLPGVFLVEEARADVWKFNMDMLESQFHTFISNLKEDETSRYEKLVDSSKQRIHMACRGLLRLVVSQYVRQDPKQIQFSYNSYGKPYLLSHPAFMFNVSHSGNWFYIIVSQNDEIGIDCELINNKNIGNLARKILNRKDYAQFKDLSQQVKPKRLIQAWTQKEAFIKAIGKGLFYQSLKDIHVDLSGSVHTSILNYHDGDRWITKTLTICDDHITSICYKKGEK
jgi:4'-phosphopantetheinyl transferase